MKNTSLNSWESNWIGRVHALKAQSREFEFQKNAQKNRNEHMIADPSAENMETAGHLGLTGQPAEPI